MAEIPHCCFSDWNNLLTIVKNLLALMGIDYWSEKALSNPKVKYIIKTCGFKHINAYDRDLENINI